MSSRKNLQKLKARQERIRQDKHASKLRNIYPVVNILNDNILDPDFAQILRNAISQINFLEIDQFCPNSNVKDFLKELMKSESFAIYLTDIGMELCDKLHIFVWASILKNIGHSKINEYMPEQGFRVYICKNRIFVICKRFIKKTSGKFAWYNTGRKVLWNNRNYNLYYSHHMFERFMERFAWIQSIAGQSQADIYFKTASILSKFYEHSDISLFDITHSKNSSFINFYTDCTEEELASVNKMQDEQDLVITKWSDNSPVNLKFSKSNSVVVRQKDYNTMRIKLPQVLFAKRIVCPFETTNYENIDAEHNSIFIKTSLLPGFDNTPEMYALFADKKVKTIDFINSIMRDPNKRYGPEMFDAQLVYHKLGINQFYSLDGLMAYNIITRNVGEDSVFN